MMLLTGLLCCMVSILAVTDAIAVTSPIPPLHGTYTVGQHVDVADCNTEQASFRFKPLSAKASIKPCSSSGSALYSMTSTNSSQSCCFVPDTVGDFVVDLGHSSTASPDEFVWFRAIAAAPPLNPLFKDTFSSGNSTNSDTGFGFYTIESLSSATLHIRAEATQRNSVHSLSAFQPANVKQQHQALWLHGMNDACASGTKRNSGLHLPAGCIINTTSPLINFFSQPINVTFKDMRLQTDQARILFSPSQALAWGDGINVVFSKESSSVIQMQATSNANDSLVHTIGRANLTSDSFDLSLVLFAESVQIYISGQLVANGSSSFYDPRHLLGDGTGDCFLSISNKMNQQQDILSSFQGVGITSITVETLRSPKDYPAAFFTILNLPPVSKPQIDLGLAHSNNSQLGILDVTLPPFSADATGRVDSTQAVQRAVDFAFQNHLIAFFPNGTYLLNDTIECRQGEPAGNMHGAQRSMVYYIRGDTRPGHRTLFLLPDSTPGFTNRSSPKYVFHFWHENTKNESQPNISFNQVMMGVDIEIGDGNYGAIGVRHRAAQGSALEDVRVFLNDGLVGIHSAAGSGGSHHNVQVFGGAFGFDFRQAQPAPSVAGLLAVGQRCGGLLYAGLQVLTLVGANVTATASASPDYIAVQSFCSQGDADSFWRSSLRSSMLGPSSSCELPPAMQDPQPCNGAVSAYLSVFDSVIDIGASTSASTAILTKSSIVLSNVYVRGADTLVDLAITSQKVKAASSDGWSLISRLAIAQPSPPRKIGRESYRFEHPGYINGSRHDNISVHVVEKAAQGPNLALTQQHVWGDPTTFPSFLSAGAINVKDHPYNAAGDGFTDDTRAIQRALNEAASNNYGVVVLPKGIYAVSDSLVVPPAVALVGVSHHLCFVVPMSQLIEAEFPLITTVPTDNPSPVPYDKVGTAVFGISAFSWNHTGGIFSVLWKTNVPRSVYRQNGNSIKLGICDDAFPPAYCAAKAPLRKDHYNSAVVLTGQDTQGLFYTVHNEDSRHLAPSYRHLYIANMTGAPEMVRFYHLNTEHAICEANTHVFNSSNVVIFGLKSEGQYPVLWVQRSSNVTLGGYGGNACSFPTSSSYPPNMAQFKPSLFRVQDSSDVELLNVIDYDSGGTLPLENNDGAGVPCPPPTNWAIYNRVTDGNEDLSQPLDRPVFVFN